MHWISNCEMGMWTQRKSACLTWNISKMSANGWDQVKIGALNSNVVIYLLKREKALLQLGNSSKLLIDCWHLQWLYSIFHLSRRMRLGRNVCWNLVVTELRLQWIQRLLTMVAMSAATTSTTSIFTSLWFHFWKTWETSS